MPQRLLLLVLALCVAVGLSSSATAKKGSARGDGGSKPASYVLPGDKVFPEGIAREPGSKLFYVSSTTDGTIFRGDVRSPQTTVFSPGDSVRTTAIGLKSDGRGNLVVAGGATGKVFILSTADGKQRGEPLDTGAGGFLNDVAISKGFAYITDSRRPFLYRVALGRNGAVGPIEKFVDFTNSAFAYDPAAFNANGIAIDEGGKYAIIVQSGTGKLFRVGLRTKAVSAVALTGGEALINGDGLLLKGNVLYVARNAKNLIVPVRLTKQGTRGVIGTGVTGSQLKFPTTIAFDGKRLLAVNSQFDKRTAMQPPVLPFDVVAIGIPRAPKAGGKQGREKGDD